MKYRIFGNGDKDTILLLHGGGLSLGGQVALEMLAQKVIGENEIQKLRHRALNGHLSDC